MKTKILILLGLLTLLIAGYFIYKNLSTKYCWPYCSNITDEDREEILRQVKEERQNSKNNEQYKAIEYSKNVEVLDLSNQNLNGALPAEVRQMKDLKILNLSNNNFTGVPAEVGQLSKLEVLDLSNNPITGLPYEIGNLQNLKTLNLKGTNYAKADLEVIKQKLPSTVQILVD